MILRRNFYNRHTLKVAKDLLGCFLVRKIGKKIIRAEITELEAYHGEKDLACHAARGRTKRTEVMYGEAGHAYVYMIYGMYHCLNLVTGKKDFPAAVLIRGVKVMNSHLTSNSSPRAGEEDLNGPGKLCRFLKIDKKLNGWDLTKGKKLWLKRPLRHSMSKHKIIRSPRMGVDYTRHCKDWKWNLRIV